MLGHIAVNVPDLEVARAYYERLMPAVAFEPFIVPTRTRVREVHDLVVRLGSEILHEPRDFPEYPPPYHATFWLDPHGFMLEAVCHKDRD